MQYFLFGKKPGDHPPFSRIDKLLLTMKITFFLLVMMVTVTHATSMAQKVTLSLTNAKIDRVFNEIRKQTNYRFLYSDEILRQSDLITINVKNADVTDALDRVVAQSNLKYKLIAGTVTVSLASPQPERTGDVKQQDEIVVTGTVTDETGAPLMQASVVVKGVSSKGTNTDADGKFSLSVPHGSTLVISFIGYQSQELPVQSGTPMAIQLQPAESELGEVVVTALGISREKKSLGYASQEVSGDDVNRVNSGNVANALSGRAAGVQIKRNTNMGGSTNIIIRGTKSITGDNQALWVVDGIPLNNANFNSVEQQEGGAGYDYGNMAADINPDDIESINILKGAAATALYGSRAANGAVIITTKSGNQNAPAQVVLSSGVTISAIHKSTFPEYQDRYGAGYGRFYGPDGNGFFDIEDFDGDGVDDLVAPNPVYGSFGGRFDPELEIYQWNAIEPESPYYMQRRPWVAAKNGPITFFETPVTYNNSINLSGGTSQGTYRISYTNFDQKGLLPNSSLKRNSFSLNTSHTFFEKLTATATANYVSSSTIGRNETGSDFRGNPTDQFRKWWQVNVDVQELKDMYFNTKRNIRSYPNGSIDNPYWIRYENFSSDDRNRFFGNASLRYDVTDWLNILGRVSLDTYSLLQEERINKGSSKPGRYSRYNVNFREFNYDLIASFNKDLSDQFNLSGLLGLNIRRNRLESIQGNTNGGLIVDRLFSLSNSLNAPDLPKEVYERIGVDGYYGSVSLGYDNTYYLDITGRSDHSSTLPADNSTYFYPSAAASFIFSELIDSDFLSFGKLRLNYAEVGNSAPANSLMDVLIRPASFGGSSMYAMNSVKNNQNLRPENTVSYEVGLETSILNRRLSIDFSYYDTKTKDQITPVAVSSSTGYYSKFVNAGVVRNRGVEVMLRGGIIRNDNFSWDLNLNWSKNNSKVLSLFDGVENIQLFSNDISLNAHVGYPYGVIKGSDFVYVDGKRLIDQSTGKYVKTTSSDNIIGNINPDWIGGISNAFKYRGFSLNFLIDIKQGGDVFVQDLANGNNTGAYKYIFGPGGEKIYSAGDNELGNPLRNFLEDGGGIILNGVDQNGNPNTVRTRVNDNTNAFGSASAPHAMYIYDASYVKLREVSLSYDWKSEWLSRLRIQNIQVALVASNLWIIHKNTPYTDPEAGSSSGNFQGYQSGLLPSTRDIGFNLKIQF